MKATCLSRWAGLKQILQFLSLSKKFRGFYGVHLIIQRNSISLSNLFFNFLIQNKLREIGNEQNESSS